MTHQKDFEKFFSAWNRDEIGYFKVGRILLRETGSAKNLELAAKHCARDIEAEVLYAWFLGEDESDAWWLGWGGYDLEEEIPLLAALLTPDAQAKISAFDPKDNEFECETIEEYKEMLFNAYDESLTAKELKAGFFAWIAELKDEARKTLLQDLTSWTKNAKAS
ncbi:MAG: hypothetical protein COB93_12315 [Sneathiella sp.]|nr:MAG: hypothetical protein COB93_12315 [Sneathiella sp.]